MDVESVSEREDSRKVFSSPSPLAGEGRGGGWLHAMPSRSSPPSHLDAALNQDAFGAVVPDIHLHDLAVLHDETIDVAIALERGAVDPFAVQRADAVDHGLAGAGTNVEPVHLLLHPAIALRVEAGRSARMIE